jgi:hypothetical protein
MILIQNTEVKSLISELSFREFQDCLTILGDQEKEMIERYLEILTRLGVPDEELNKITIEDLIPFVNVFGKEKFEKTSIPQKITINDIVYKIHDSENYKISVKDLWQIEKQVKKDENIDLIKAISIIAKQEDVESKWHYNESHLFNKAKIFEAQSVTVFLPLIFHIGIELGEKIMLLNGTPTTV